MKKGIALLFLCLFALSFKTKAQDIVWDFATDAQGWHDLGAGRDVSASWDNGSLKMTYFENSPGQGPQLWFAAVHVDQVFEASNCRYIEIFYRPFNWPTTSPIKFLVTIKKSNDELVYAYADLDPTKNFVSLDIGTLDPGWGTPYTGTMKSLEIELPHTGATASNPATNWFGAWTMIDKVVLCNTQTVPPSTDKVLHWTFDKDFSDSTIHLTGSASGNPFIDATSAKAGSGALLLSGSDYITIPADSVLSSEKCSYTFWVKTPAAGQVNPAIPARIISYGSGNFELAFYQGNLSMSAYRTWYNIPASWKNNEWQHLALVVDGSKVTCYINGIKTDETISSTSQSRSGNLAIGINGLKAIIDELSIYNYLLSEEEIAEVGLIPPSTVSPWTFDSDLQGWHEITDGSNRDVSLSWADGAMVMTYSDKAVTNGPQLWFPQAEVKTGFDADLYPYCDIYYQTQAWPVSSTLKALLEFTRADGTIAYSYFDLSPSETYVRVDIADTDPGWGEKYSGRIVSVRLEIPHNASATPAEDWFGASAKITKIELNNTQPIVEDAWNTTLENSAFTKSGIDRLNNLYYQYQPIGLGGTVMRVDPWGFGFQKAPGAATDYWHHHEPYFGYEYWWDKEGHRFNPFRLKAGYGASFNPGTITSYNQSLDIRTGELVINLTLDVDGTSFTSQRNVLVTPEGILVIRVKDAGAPSPLKLNIVVETDVRIYQNYGVYNVPHDPWTGSATSREVETLTQGGVVTATRPGTSTAALAVAVESISSVALSDNNTVYSTTETDGTVTFYIAPASSFNPATPDVPWDYAWNAAYAAKQKGFETLRQETAAWWINYLNRSKISVPDETVAKLYAQSLYYHGVYFGESAIPPGCNSTDIESFAGAVCPEYDLVFSQLALAYTGHLDEAKNIADWTYSVLPKTKLYATQGVTQHNVSKLYSGGAKYTTLMGFDGAQLILPTVGESVALHYNASGANCALMALSYLDFSDDETFRLPAYDVLKSTTYVSLEDLMYDSRYDSYRDKNVPSAVQQSSALMGYNECVKRGIANPEWSIYDGKILIPKTTLFGEPLIAGGVGAAAQEGVGDATWLQHLWWTGTVDKHDPLARPSYENSAKSTTGNYVFNNGWMGVVAAKVYLGNEALSWLKNFELPNDILYDQTCFAEARGQFNLTPEIGAHGAYICNLSQMLIDPDNDQTIDIFPAIPDVWEYKNIAFTDLLAKGALSVSAARDLQGVKVDVTNNSKSTKERELRIGIPRLLYVDGLDEADIADGFIVNNISLLPGETKSFEYTFTTMGTISSIKTVGCGFDADLFKIYPNPNSSGILNITNSEKIDELLVYSLTGKVLRKFINQTESYNISGLESGVYIIQIKADNIIYSKRLFVLK
jgi:hypothetical protein